MCQLCKEVQKGEMSSKEVAYYFNREVKEQKNEHWIDIVALIANVGQLPPVLKELRKMNEKPPLPMVNLNPPVIHHCFNCGQALSKKATYSVYALKPYGKANAPKAELTHAGDACLQCYTEISLKRISV